jgi:exonuclease SbcC
MIKQLRLRHWKSHEQTEVTFGKGTNLLVGAMGSGKTSVLEAICFALFGTFPALKSKRVKLAEVVMQRPTKYEEASVELWFSVGEVDYSVERTVKSGASEAFLRAGGRMLESGSERVTETIGRILRMDYDLFTRAIYSEQNRVDYFLSLGKGERKKQIDALLGIDQLESARANAGTLSNRIRTIKTADEAFLQGIGFEEVETELLRVRVELEGAITLGEELKKKHAGQERELGQTQKLVAQLDAAEKKFNELSRQAAAVESLVTSTKEMAGALEKQLEKKYSKTDLQAAVAATEKSLESLKNARRALEEVRGNLGMARGEKQALEKRLSALPDGSKPIGEVEAALNGLEKQVADAKAIAKKSVEEHGQTGQQAADLSRKLEEAKAAVLRATELEKQLSELRQSASAIGEAAAIKQSERELEETAAGHNARALELEKAISALDTADSKCPVCGQSLDEEHRKHTFQEKSIALGIARAGAKAAGSQAIQARERLAKLDGLSRTSMELEQRLAILKQAPAAGEVEGQLTAAKAGLVELIQKVAAGESRLLALEKELASMREVVGAARERAQALKTLSEIEAKLRQFSEAEERLLVAFSEEKVGHAQALLKQLEKAGRLLALEEKLALEEGRLAGLRKELDATKFDSAELQSSREKLTGIEREEARTEGDVAAMALKVTEKRVALAELEKKHGAVRERLARVKSLEKKVIGVTKFQEALFETQAALRGELVGGINEAMAGLWKTIYPYRDYPAARLLASEDDYELQLQTIDGNWVSVDSASGGERACGALSLRTAFAVVLAPSLSWLFLDEPTHNLDSTAVQMLSHALRDEVPRIVEQTFIITHDENLREAASAKIYRVERDKDSGDKSTVEEVTV